MRARYEKVAKVMTDAIKNILNVSDSDMWLDQSFRTIHRSDEIRGKNFKHSG
jgi:hypothetical protein